jgi:hypothetical protein
MFITVSSAMRVFFLVEWETSLFFSCCMGKSQKTVIALLRYISGIELHLLIFPFAVAHRFLRHQRFENE